MFFQLLEEFKLELATNEDKEKTPEKITAEAIEDHEEKTDSASDTNGDREKISESKFEEEEEKNESNTEVVKTDVAKAEEPTLPLLFCTLPRFARVKHDDRSSNVYDKTALKG